jgi:hypothetical protein
MPGLAYPSQLKPAAAQPIRRQARPGHQADHLMGKSCRRSLGPNGPAVATRHTLADAGSMPCQWLLLAPQQGMASQLARRSAR